MHGDTSHLRLFQWVALSLFIHIALVTFVGGITQVSPHRPLVVDIQHIAAETAGPLTRPKTAETPDLPVENTQSPAPATASNSAPTPPKPAVDLPVPFDGYLSANEVDVRAEPANDPALSYPAEAYVRRMHGIVKLRLFISEEGNLDRVELLDAAPKGIFEKAALEAAGKLRFYPATRLGRPVKSQKTIEVVFDPVEEFKRQ